ncbi:MAG: DUF885 domain-containing protein, partial [Nannocystaceae bacterium]|nr:DUF885 domain-containing protein [Nannocystaceae bacterium]
RRGLHEYDGALPDFTAEGLTATVESTAKAIETLETFNPGGLAPRQRAERAALLTTLEEVRFRIEVLKEPQRNPMFYVGILDLTPYVSRDYAPIEQRAEAIISFAEAVPAHLTAAKANLDSNLPRAFIQTALIQARGTASFVRTDVPAAMDSLPKGPLAARLAKALEGMATALDGYSGYLEEAAGRATDEFALGPDVFQRMLQSTQGIDVELGALEVVIRADLERNLTAMTAAAAQISSKKSTAAVIARVQRDKPKLNRVLEEATAQSVQMKAFLQENDIVTIPSDDEAQVVQTPPFMRWNAAFLSGAGVFETKPLPSFYYISPPDPSWSKSKQRDYIPGRADLLFITIHEVWPGHFLHSLNLKKSDSQVLKALWNYATGEGWAHYTEEMMWEAGFTEDPAVHVGQLQNALLRDVRSLCAIGLHTQNMTVETCRKMFVEKAYQSEGNAEQESRRGTFDPMYLAYTTGKLIIKKMRADLEAKAEAEGKPFNAKAFHDELLSYGAAPLSAIRAGMVPDAPNDLL